MNLLTCQGLIRSTLSARSPRQADRFLLRSWALDAEDVGAASRLGLAVPGKASEQMTDCGSGSRSAPP